MARPETATTDAQGRWVIAGMPSGNFKAKAEMAGFRTSTFNLNYDANQAVHVQLSSKHLPA